MKKQLLFLGLAMSFYLNSGLSAHCQMPCGIYHDNMVFDQIDQYIETMYKGITVLNEDKNRLNTVQGNNEFVRWVITKEKMSDDIAELILTYFLQQKMKPGEDETPKRLEAAHKMLFLLVQIKQHTDRDIVNQFTDAWDEFKKLYHVENYECQIDIINQRRRQQPQEQHDHNHDHDHDHDDHDHDHNHTH